SAVDGLKTFFTNVVRHQGRLGFDETEGLRAHLRGTADAIEQQIATEVSASGELDAARLLKSLEILRRHELEFIAWRDELNIRVRFFAELGNFNAIVDGTSLTQETKGQIRQGMATYAEAFRDVMQSTGYVDGFLNAINNTSRDLIPVIEGMAATAAANLEAATAELTRSRTRIATIMIIVACLAIGMGVGLSSLIGLGISRQNQRFDAALSTMAEGLCMLDAKMNIINCNDHYRELFH